MDIERLIAQSQVGDREALGIIYTTYLTPMRKIVAHYVQNPEAVRDILHDGFIIAFTSIGTLKDASKIEPWLGTIMKNLSLQYLKQRSASISVLLSDIPSDSKMEDEDDSAPELTLEEITKIIDRLPKGYGKVFRLAVIDGKSHKEIGALLGIAPHSSSSQLAHAKAMMRRLITKYRIEMGVLSIVAMILLVWHGLLRHRDDKLPDAFTSNNADRKEPVGTDSISDTDTSADKPTYKIKAIYKTSTPQAQSHIAKLNVAEDSVHVNENDSIIEDTVRWVPRIDVSDELIAIKEQPHRSHPNSSEWSLSLAYAGNLGQSGRNQYMTPNPGIPDVEGPSDEIEVTEKTRHHMPLTIGLSINKSLTPRWSVETGLRYTFLKSDFHAESKLLNKETVQRIHYIGVPIKFNYRICTYNGLSMYAHGGGALDIPVYGRQSVWQKSPDLNTPETGIFKIHAPVQWSAEGGFGIQYHFTPSFSIYAEPSFRYYFNTGSDIKTIRQDKPFEFTIPVGLRIMW